MYFKTFHFNSTDSWRKELPVEVTHLITAGFKYFLCSSSKVSPPLWARMWWGHCIFYGISLPWDTQYCSSHDSFWNQRTEVTHYCTWTAASSLLCWVHTEKCHRADRWRQRPPKHCATWGSRPLRKTSLGEAQSGPGVSVTLVPRELRMGLPGGGVTPRLGCLGYDTATLQEPGGPRARP